MTAGGTKTPIDPGIVARVSAGIRYAITGKAPEWFGPGEPMAPVVPASDKPSVEGRQWDFPAFVNTTPTVRQGEAITFAQLRALSESCDVLRIVIETRKDQLEKLAWTIKPRNEDKGSDSRCDAIANALRLPDQEHTWVQWLRMVLEDLFVLDAPALYVRRTVGGTLYAIEPIDGATIKRVLDDHGRTPMPPAKAYQQVLKGMPAVDYTRDELIYLPRNPRTHKIYGYSPVEQIVMTVNIALRRALHQLQFYTEGNIPESLIGVPETWNPDQIRQFQEYWDALLGGNTAARRHAKFVPGSLKIQETKPGALKDDFDEWLARIVCFAFSISPTPFVKTQNRATAESAQEQALSEGLAPLMGWVKALMDLIIGKHFNAPDLEFQWDQGSPVDPLVQAQIHQIYVQAKIKTADEVRAELGADPLTAEQRAELTPQPPPMLPPAASQQPPEPTPAKEALAKAKKPVSPIDRERQSIARKQKEIQQVVADFLAEQATDVAKQVIDLRGEFAQAVAGDIKQADAVLDGVVFRGWATLAGDVQGIMEAVCKDGSIAALAQIGIAGAVKPLDELTPDEKAEYLALLKQVNERAVAYAADRSAELVGMRRVGGKLVQNPNAAWRIDESTREMLRSDVIRAMDEGMSNEDLADLIQQNYGFSDARSENIARTETAFADSAGNMSAYRASGVVAGKRWITGAGCCDLCEALDGVEVPLDADFPDGGDCPPLHPQCRCACTPVLAEENSD